MITNAKFVPILLTMVLVAYLGTSLKAGRPQTAPIAWRFNGIPKSHHANYSFTARIEKIEDGEVVAAWNSFTIETVVVTWHIKGQNPNNPVFHVKVECRNAIPKSSDLRDMDRMKDSSLPPKYTFEIDVGNAGAIMDSLELDLPNEAWKWRPTVLKYAELIPEMLMMPYPSTNQCEKVIGSIWPTWVTSEQMKGMSLKLIGIQEDGGASVGVMDIEPGEARQKDQIWDAQCSIDTMGNLLSLKTHTTTRIARDVSISKTLRIVRVSQNK